MFKTLKLIMVVAVLVGNAQAKPQAQQKKEDAGPDIATEMIQSVLANVVQSGCHFQFTGSMNPKDNQINTFDLDCALLFKDNVRVNVMKKKSGSTPSGVEEQFKAEIILETKNLWAVLKANKEKEDGKLSLRFYPNSQVKSGKKPWKESALIARAATNVNANILTVNVSAVDIAATVDPKNPKKYSINGKCISHQEFLDINVGRVVKRPAKCFVTGTFEAGVGANLEYGYVDSQQGVVKP